MKAIRRFELKILATLASIALIGDVQAQSLANVSRQESSIMVGYEKKFIPWEQFDGKLVEVEGMAWGGADKGLGAHLRLAQNDEVYLENLNTTNADLDGRLLNVVGIFRKKRVEKAPPGAQGYGQSFDYFSIEVIAARKIDKVVQDQVLPARNEWIVPGMPAATALQQVQARQWQAYPLAVTAVRDGSMLHSFRVDEQRVLCFSELKGQIVRVYELRLNDPRQRADDRMIELPGLELPPLTAAKSMDK